jgi:two-component system, LytTR family, response regulator LytT
MKTYIIVEDEAATARRLKRLISDSIFNLEFLGFHESIESTVAFLRNNKAPDLIFLDIELADGNSFKIFELINVSSPVIFTTAYDEFALKAFKVNSIDYLLKPINVDDLNQALSKWNSIKAEEPDWSSILTNLQTNRKYKERILITQGDKLIPINISQILMFRAEDKSVFINTISAKSILIKETLEELSKSLNPDVFFRVNRSYLINRSAIINASLHFNGKLKLTIKDHENEEVMVSRDKANEFKEWYGT